MMTSRELSILIPVRDESASLARVLCRLPNALEVIVIDDGSTDRSAEIAESAGAKVIRHPHAQGYGAALKTGILASSGRYVAIIDGDGTYDPVDLNRVLRQLEPGGLAIGVRSSEPATARLLLKHLARLEVRVLAGVEVADLNSGLRAFDRALVERLWPVLPDRFSFTTTTTLGALALGAPIAWVPVSYRPRGGQSKFAAMDAARLFATAWRGAGWIRAREISGSAL